MGFPFMKELSIITQENLSTRFFQTLRRSSGPLHCARLVTGPCQLCVRRGCSLGRGEQGSRVTLVCGTPKDAAGFCPSEGNFSVFNIAVTWLELNKVLFKIERKRRGVNLRAGRLYTCKTHTITIVFVLTTEFLERPCAVVLGPQVHRC